MATPQVPPRPSRSRLPAPAVASEANHAAPKVPPRPAGRRKELSVSPDRYAPSPLNDLPRKPSSSGLYSNAKNNRSSSSIDPPQRPPSVNLPSLGQEGNEYGDLEWHEQQQNALEKTKSEPGTKTSHVDSDLPLHAPRPALSKSNAKAQVAAVTRTDSSQAAAALGIKSPPRDDPDPFGRPLKSKTSSGYMRSGSALSTERPPSASQLDEHGIPQIGRHVPLLFNAGDVQAPSPGPGAQIGPLSDSVEDLRQQRHHRRKHSGREVFHGPPGSYGLHGHNTSHADQFEKSWYAKHPEEQMKEEQGHYGSALSGNRPEFALSSDDLNKLVRGSTQGAGIGTARNIVGLPDEQIGYMASDEYANRLNSPRSQSGKHRRQSNSQTHVESPLRKSSFPKDSIDGNIIPTSQPAAESEVQPEAENVIHIDPPEDPVNRITGEGVDTPESHGNRRTSSDMDFADDRGYHAPILAADEVRPGSEWQQPAMSPSFPPDRRGSAHYDDFGGLHRHLSHLGGSASSSRAGSRPGSIHGIPPLTKIYSHDEHEDRHTPLEDVEEYEPLFPDDDGKLKKATTPAERFKQRPEMKRRFPSQDIWEDTPDSLQLETEVMSPEPAEQRLHPESAAPESTSVEETRHEAPQLADSILKEGNELTPNEELRARLGYKAGAPSRISEAVSQRFPSRDIWEDSPDYAALTTIVMDPEEQNTSSSAVVDESVDANDATINAHPSVPLRPSRTRSSGASQEPGSHPSVPPRPPKKKFSTESAEFIGDGKPTSTEARKPPSVPDRPKPHVPSRPSKSVSRDSNEDAPLSKSVSAGSAGSVGEEGVRSQKPPPPAVKAKPNIPLRPGGSKIAALQAGFMADLNSRLKVGPTVQQPQKKDEIPEEKIPLQDARKGRARGPTRRKPGALAASQQTEAKTSAPELTFSTVWTVWHSEPNGSIVVPPVTEALPQKGTSSTEDVSQPAKIDSLDSVPTEAPLVAEPEPLPHKETSKLAEEAVPLGDKEPELPAPPREVTADNETIESNVPPEIKDGASAHVQAEDPITPAQDTKTTINTNVTEQPGIEPHEAAATDSKEAASAAPGNASEISPGIDSTLKNEALSPSANAETATATAANPQTAIEDLGQKEVEQR